MRYKGWQESLEKLHEKAKSLLVDEEVLCESFQDAKGDTYKVFLGDNISYWLNGEKTNDYPFRRAFASKEKGWQQLLGGLETKVTLAEALHIDLIEAAVQPYIKEAVLDRLTGKDDMLDNGEIIEAAAKKRKERLTSMLPVSPNKLFRVEFALKSPSEHYELNVHYNYTGVPSLEYANGLKASWSFLRNYDKIEAIIKEFAGALKPVFKLCKSDKR